MSINSIVKASIFCALAIGLGFVFMPVPNFEFITVTVFLSGLYLNSAWGFLIGCTTITIYSGFNPMGSGLAFPPLFLGQVITMGFIDGFNLDIEEEVNIEDVIKLVNDLKSDLKKQWEAI